MSAVCLEQKKLSKTEACLNIFSDLNTEVKSYLFMKQITTTCISTILHLRKVFPDNYFEPKNFEGVTVRILKSGDGNKFIKKIDYWLEGAFEAIEKKYLKHLILDIKDAESNLSLEIYTMTFAHKKGKKELNILFSKNNYSNSSEFTFSNTRIMTVKLLQMCHVITQTCSSLPSQVTISIRLSYHEDTPQNYHPRGYKLWKPTDPEFPKTPRSIEIGVVATNHHFFKLVNKSCLNEKLLQDLVNVQSSESSLSQDQILNDFEPTEKEENFKAKKALCFDQSREHSLIKTSSVVQEKENENVSVKPDLFTKKYPKNENIFKGTNLKNEVISSLLVSENCSFSQTLTNASSLENYDLEREPDKVRCCCMNSNKSEGMFRCLRCKNLAHVECYGIFENDLTKKIKFCCRSCHQPEGKFKCHDRIMNNLQNSSDQQKLSILRRVLKYCYQPHITKITLKKIEKIAGTNTTSNVIKIILKKMNDIGVAVPQEKKKNFIINKTILSKVLFKYFYKLRNSSVSSQSRKSIVKPQMVRL